MKIKETRRDDESEKGMVMHFVRCFIRCSFMEPGDSF